jgi:lysozyme
MGKKKTSTKKTSTKKAGTKKTKVKKAAAKKVVVKLKVKDATANYIFGIDVSHHQGKIDWLKVAKGTSTIKPVRFAYMKTTEGVGYADPECRGNALGARKNGIAVGYYHFATPSKDQQGRLDATDEAVYFKSVIKNLPKPDLPLVLDVEKNSGLSKTEMLEWIKDFLGEFTGPYFSFMIYGGSSFLNENLPSVHDLGQYPLWLAQYRKETELMLPNGWKSWSVWQYAETGIVSGINGNCDVNFAKAGSIPGAVIQMMTITK